MRTIALDFETYYSKKRKYSVRSLSVEQYVEHPDFDPYLMSVSDGQHAWTGEPKDFNWASLEGARLLSHNKRFDESVYDRMVTLGLAPRVKPADWYCTANLTAYLCNRRALADASAFLLKRKLDKKTRDDADGKHWADFSAEARAEMLQYAKVDAEVCWEIWHKFSHRWPEHERRLSNMTIAQGRRGIAINVPLLQTYLAQTAEVKLNLEQVIPWVAGVEDDEYDEFDGKPTSTKAIAYECHKHGIPCPPVKSEDEEGYEVWETTYAPHHAWIRVLSQWRGVNRLLRVFQRIHARLQPGGIFPFGLKYFGAHTGRWSGDGGVNMQNPNKLPLVIGHDGLPFFTAEVLSAVRHHKLLGNWPDSVRWTIDLRHLFIPRPGTQMIVSDLSQIEPRVLAWLCGNKPFLAAVATGMSPYEAHARDSMGWTGGKLAKEAPDLYTLAKVRVLSLGYGAGWQKLITMAADYGLNLTKDDPEWEEAVDPISGEDVRLPGYGLTARNTVADFRRSNPLIPALWNRLNDAMHTAAMRQEDFSFVLPSGRRMTYESPRVVVSIEADKQTGRPRKTRELTAGVGGKRKKFYGGKLAENVTQAIARDVFAFHLLRLDDAGFTGLFSAHDEAVNEAGLDRTTKEVGDIMGQTPPWMPGLPVAADVKAVAHYLK